MGCGSRYTKLAKFGQVLLSKTSIPDGLPHITQYAKEVLYAQRCSIFMYDSNNEELWTTIADGVERIILPSNKGLVGQTLRERRAIIENAPYRNSNFSPEIDSQTGFTTINIITAPIFDSTKEVIGVLELLNKDGGFSEDDAKFMTFFAHYISGFLELINVYIKEGEI